MLPSFSTATIIFFKTIPFPRPKAVCSLRLNPPLSKPSITLTLSLSTTYPLTIRQERLTTESSPTIGSLRLKPPLAMTRTRYHPIPVVRATPVTPKSRLA
ncbi:hypothetical protein L2E82_04670 [Cichorium intybus]|uniref:Uncharacterized protein n=1 Tax=Cichorium intybus TaxID=13427 RepID=A0ACB9H5Q3_CICIN|nr:hypothetical protein L2E82_04670 [Cichorium intybus]